MAEPAAARCDACGAERPAGLLACAACGALTHSARLKQLASLAGEAEARVDLAAALAAWREALELLPSTTRQHAVVAEKIQSLSARVGGAAPPPPDRRGWKSAASAVGALFLGLLAKGKLLLAGLTKAATLWSMLLAFGVYWTAFGWRFAVGLVATIYVHEMGHVMALARYGIAATAPMFIPGFGAVVRLKQHPMNVDEDAAVGLAGPIWGSAAACACYGVALVTGWPSWMAIARTAAWINLFNLLPVWQLDGGRAFNALSKPMRVAAAGALLLAYFAASDGLLLLLAIAAFARAFGPRAPERGNRGIFVSYVALTAVLTALASVKVALDSLAR
jgi:Zn-dependent protease